MRRKTEETNFVLKFVRYDSMSMPAVYPPPPVPSDFQIGHRFPKSAMPPPPPPPQLSAPAGETLIVEPPKQPSIQHDANTRGLLLGDLSFLSRPPPNMSVPPPPPPPPAPAPPKEVVQPATTAPSGPLEWDKEKERSSHAAPAPMNNARAQFLDAVKNRFTSSADSAQLTESQSMEAAFQVRTSAFSINSSRATSFR